MEANTITNKTLRPCIEESKDWDNTENLYIEGDNLEVLKLLQNSYFNKVKMIYIDIYSDNSLDSLSSLIMLSHLKVEMVYQCQ